MAPSDGDDIVVREAGLDILLHGESMSADLLWRHVFWKIVKLEVIPGRHLHSILIGRIIDHLKQEGCFSVFRDEPPSDAFVDLFTQGFSFLSC